MKLASVFAVYFLPTVVVAGSLFPLVDDAGLSAHSLGVPLEGVASETNLSAAAPLPGLEGRAPEVLLDGQSVMEGLDGIGTGRGLTGFVSYPVPKPETEGLPTPEPEVRRAPEPIQYELRDLHFEIDSAVLAQAERTVIAELAAIIDQTRSKSITLIGHTDRRGSSNYNLWLSERRAQAVLNALVEWHGLNPAVFEAIGRGEEELVSKGITEADHARDRRVVVVLSKVD